jgi:D-xylonolactonase
MNLQLITDQNNELGENPLWHPAEKKLYWEDILKGRIYRYDPTNDETETIYEGELVGGFTFQPDGSLLLFMARGRVALLKDGELTTLIEEIPAERESRFNDVIADPQGRVFCGTMPTGETGGRLYRLNRELSLTPLVDNVQISNGMGFTLDHKYFYYTESGARKIHIFDYDETTGALTNQRLWRDFSAGPGVPDGMTVDSEGYIWSARWDGSGIFRYAPDGSELEKVAIPAKKVTSLCFGGDDLRDLYITTALNGGTKAEEGDGAGAIFRLRVDEPGLPEFYSKVGL